MQDNSDKNNFSLRHKVKLRDLTGSSTVDIVKNQENRLLTLRKKQIDKFILSKRFLLSPEDKMKINPKDLNVPNQYQMNLNEFLNNLNLDFIEELIFSDEISLIKYGVFLLRNAITSKEDYAMKNIILITTRPNVLNRLFTVLNFPDLKLQYEASWFIINFFTFLEDVNLAYQLFNIESNKNNFYEFFINSEDELFENALWIVGNIASSFQFIRDYFFEEKLYEKIEFCLINCFSNMELIERITWLIANITKGNIGKYQDKIELLIPFLIKIFRVTKSDRELQLNNDIMSELNKDKTSSRKLTQKTFNYMIWIFLHLSSLNILKKDLFNHNLHVDLISILTAEDNQLNREIWRILGNFACSEDSKTQLLIMEGIVNSIKNYIYRDFYSFDFKILKEVLFTTCNIACGTLSQIQELIKNGIIKRIWELLIKFHEIIDLALDSHEFMTNRDDAIKSFRECVYIIIYSINGALEKSRREIITAAEADIANLFTSIMNFFNHEIELITMILVAIQHLIALEENSMELEVDNHFFFLKENLIKSGIQGILTKYQNTDNDNLYEIIENLNEELFPSQT